jgi:hypothetical protein
VAARTRVHSGDEHEIGGKGESTLSAADGVMGSVERAMHNERCPWEQHIADRIDAGDVQDFINGQAGEDGWREAS